MAYPEYPERSDPAELLVGTFPSASIPLFLVINGQCPVNDICRPQALLILEARRDDLDSTWGAIHLIGVIWYLLAIHSIQETGSLTVRLRIITCCHRLGVELFGRFSKWNNACRILD